MHSIIIYSHSFNRIGEKLFQFFCKVSIKCLKVHRLLYLLKHELIFLLLYNYAYHMRLIQHASLLLTCNIIYSFIKFSRNFLFRLLYFCCKITRGLHCYFINIYTYKTYIQLLANDTIIVQ